MSDKKYTIQDFQDVTADGLLPRVRELKADGYRLAQMCASKKEEGSGCVCPGHLQLE